MSPIPSRASILKAVFKRLDGDATLKAACPSIYNHIPQDESLPCIRVRWDSSTEWDTKDSAGFEGSIIVDIWTDHRGDKQALEISDRVTYLLHNQPLTGLTYFIPPNGEGNAQSLILRHALFDEFTEPDGLTHHTVLRFNHIATT